MNRKKPLKRSTKPIARRSKPRARKADPKKRRFADKRDMAYQGWVRQQPCVLAGNPVGHLCLGEVQCCHFKSRGAGGEDRGNCFPCCAGGHRLQHFLGVRSFQFLFDVDLSAVVSALAARYTKETE